MCTFEFFTFDFYYVRDLSLNECIFSKMSSTSLCPHLVQEYFERVSDILTTYRPQILKQVEYDKISENLVLRGAVRQEEHIRISQCENLEGQVSQMLVVIQNRMWGLENLLAAFMEEHVSPWLTHEMFRAYMEHLVNPLKKQKDSQTCQCVQISNSVLYRGWVKALKSLDSWIYKTGTQLGFIGQILTPTDNMLAFLNEKLAEYTGGDSSQDDLVPYGFAPNSSGDVQVAELEEDDFNDLISLSETLSIEYHAQYSDTQCEAEASSPSVHVPTSTGSQELVTIPETTVLKSRPPTKQSRSSRRQRSTSTSDEVPSSDASIPTTPMEQKLSKQKELAARLSAPKSVKTPSSNSPVRLRNTSESKLSSSLKQRPKSAEFYRSSSQFPPSSTSSNTTSSSGNLSKPDKQGPGASSRATGKTSGFVRSKSNAPSSPKSRTAKVSSSKSKPTAVAKPNLKASESESKEDRINVRLECDDDDGLADKSGVITEAISTISKAQEDSSKRNSYLDEDDEWSDEDEIPAMSSLTLKNTILHGDERSEKKFDYYQLNFSDEMSDYYD